MNKQKVFVNRILNLKRIKFVGLDMDHTLIRYKTRAFESLVYQLVVDKLIRDKGYPERLRELQFNFDDAIRGLVIDSKNGNILKLSRYGAIRTSYHGTKLINYQEQQKIYHSMYVDLGDPNYMVIDTSFSIAFCALYGQLVDIKDKSTNELPSYYVIAQDVLFSLDKAHADGSLKTVVAEDLDKYVVKDKEVVEGLKRFQKHGKKIFILTNSDYFYSKLLLDYAITPFLEKGEHWQDLFEYVITLSDKPRFFYDNLRFMSVESGTGSMQNFSGPLTPGIYQGGCASKFTDDLKLKGDEILYVGDHIYGDILRLKKDCNWHTALVVEELGDEIASQEKAMPVERKISELMEVKKALELEHVELSTQYFEKGNKKLKDNITQVQRKIAIQDTAVSALLTEQQGLYNQRWDRIFRAGAEESYFAYQVDRYASIYMEKLADLLEHSPLTYFRPKRRSLAHDIELS